MFANRANNKRIGCLLLSLFICLLAGIGFTKYQENVACFSSRPSLQGFVLSIERNEQQLLIDQARKFANQHGFKFDIAYFSKSGQDFRIDMIRKDVELVIWNTVVDLDRYDVHFYNYDCVHPTTPTDIADLESELEKMMNEIPSTIIREEKE